MSGTVCTSCGEPISEAGRFCPSCGEAVVHATSAPTRAAALDPGRFKARPSTPSLASDGGRFLPGQVLNERYRVIGLLGKGGMGEVYRADDLKLGQPVALKFLPEAFSRDEARLERFFNEVRTARQVSHPNVCRVHDLGEVDGHHFLSMEYVDGEDLGTLLRRIGRVPKDKAVQIARQLCAGLAAAHDEGILHRDLKPANIMLDGRGRARITDFGLAGLAESIEGGEIRAGTPAYQAPEQLSGKEVSKASDIYGLGLVLYELFTGKRAFKVTSAAELIEKQQSATPASMASHVEGLDDTIERIVLRCLETEPDKRPDSPLDISAALPGGDPLAAALAAGETPSPEMVANAEVKGALRLPVALALLAVILAGVGAEFGYRSSHSSRARTGLPKSPSELRVLARQVLDDAGYDVPVGDSAWGLETGGYYDWVHDTDESQERWDDLESVRPHPVYFWFRQSPEWMAVEGFDSRVTETSPAFSTRGMAAVRLDAEGRLLELQVLPPEVVRGGADTEIDWRQLLDRAGLDVRKLTEVPARARPLLNCEQKMAWEGGYGDPHDVLLHVEACGAAGEPLYFAVFAPWDNGYEELTAELPVKAAEEDVSDAGDILLTVLRLTIFVSVLTGSLLLARRNVRLGRTDRLGAFRIAVVIFIVNLTAQILYSNHGASMGEIAVLGEVVAHVLLVTMLVWVFYLAVEPFIRRLWPNAIIAWRRVLEGRFRDPLVGRDFLIGGAVAQIVIFGRLSNAVFQRDPPVLLGGGPLESISGVAASSAWVLSSLAGNVFQALVVMTLVVVARIVLRKNWLTWLVLTSLMVTLMTLTFRDNIPSQELPLAVLQIALYQGAFILLVIRFGLLAVVAQNLYSGMYDLTRVLDPDSWYFGYAIFYLILLLVPAISAFWVSLGDRKIFGGNLLDV